MATELFKNFGNHRFAIPDEIVSNDFNVMKPLRHVQIMAGIDMKAALNFIMLPLSILDIKDVIPIDNAHALDMFLKAYLPSGLHEFRPGNTPLEYTLILKNLRELRVAIHFHENRKLALSTIRHDQDNQVHDEVYHIYLANAAQRIMFCGILNRDNCLITDDYLPIRII